MVSAFFRNRRAPAPRAAPPAPRPVTPALVHLRALLDAPVPEDAPGDVRDAHLAAVVAAATALPADDLVAAGMLARSGDGYAWSRTPWPRTWTRSVLCTAPGDGGRRRAVWWRSRTRGVVRLWVDGTGVDLPPFDDRSPVQDAGSWVAGRLFVMEVAAVDHPRHDPERPDGGVFGLLVCDADTGAHRLELPADDDDWPMPVVRVDGGRARLLPAPSADPVRTWPLDPDADDRVRLRKTH